MMPLNEVAMIARRQLAAWQEIARTWQLTAQGRHLRCADCGQSVIVVTDHLGHRYRYTPDEWLALIVAHLRQNHTDLDPDT